VEEEYQLEEEERRWWKMICRKRRRKRKKKRRKIRRWQKRIKRIIKYVTLFLPSFDTPSLCHTLSQFSEAPP